LARNEREAAQFVLRPTEPLHNLHVISQTLQSETGVILPADAVEILRVAYVPVTQPTDSVGTVAPWPDPLPPLAGAINLDAGENQPFWVCIHTQTNTPAVVYKGTLLLEADGWRGSVPLEVEVFDFPLPDRKTCVSAFGFNAPLAFRYHHVDTEFDRRKVYEEYLSILSNHHISIYNPAFLDPIQYDWSHLPEWQGGERDNTVSYRGQVSLLLRDESETANVAVSYDEPFSIPDEGLHIEFQYKTGEPGHSFLATVQYFDISGTWIRGNNTDITIEGDASWQHFAKTVNDFPKEAHQFKLRLWATPFNEEGVYTGNVWIDDIKLSTDVVLIQDDFETWDTGELETLFVPEFDWTAWDTAMTRAFDHYHFNGFRLSIPGLGSGTFHARSEPSLLGYGENTEEYKIAFSMWCRLVETHLREKGWLDDAYVYWFDEPDPDDYKFVMNGFRKLKETAPGLNRMLTEQIESELVGGPNIWCPISNQYDHNMAEQRRAAGEKNWWYVCTGPKAPYATLFIDHPATELRVWLWQTWKRAIDGILIWQTNYWHSNTAYPDGLQNPYEDPMGWVSGYSTPIGTKRPWGNGDGRFIYPPLAAVDSGTDNPVFDAPVSSIRLEMLRDGIEDYEYCVILRDLLEAYKDNLPESDLAK
ncbi:MAG: DUF4091 domain-containing protein, partial [Candidatus Hydrogenedentes bacterium]|nr:DUF4091 domain-containing protein [Candidatus Hydrogenedentota bacterium]